MTREEIQQLEAHLRRTFSNDRINVPVPKRGGQPVEVRIGEEFIGVLHRDDEEDGEVSYTFMMSILDFDLPPKA
jgi:hypothetical protein